LRSNNNHRIKQLHRRWAPLLCLNRQLSIQAPFFLPHLPETATKLQAQGVNANATRRILHQTHKPAIANSSN
jgi:hypothetical protein